MPIRKSSTTTSKEDKAEATISPEIQNDIISTTNIDLESAIPKDIDKIAEYHENILDEEFEEDENEINFNQNNKKFEHFVKRHELLQEEIKMSANNHNFKFANTSYRTYLVGDNREGKWENEVYENFAKKPALLRKHFASIYCGYHHTTALDGNCYMYTWGRNSNGQLGQGEVQNQAIPNLLARPLTWIEISEVSWGWQHTMAVTSYRFLYTLGLNSNGQLGHGDYEDRNTPALVESIIFYTVEKISAGYLHSAMINNNGTLFTWGANPDSRLWRKIIYYKLSMRAK